jgi:lipopolysaccharide export system permease protein
MRKHKFERQDGTFPVEEMGAQAPKPKHFTAAQTSNINELEVLIDSLQKTINEGSLSTYVPMLKNDIFARDTTILPTYTTKYDRSQYKEFNVYDSLANVSMRTNARIYSMALNSSRSAQGAHSFDEHSSKTAISQLYLAEVEWHRKFTLPMLIILFFVIGASLGAIIKKGGLGTPIVISVIFFVIYYIISIPSEKMVKEGTLDATIGMWFPLVILTPIAIYLLRKATHDTSLLDRDWYDVKLRKLRRAISKAMPKWMKSKKKNKQNA